MVLAADGRMDDERRRMRRAAGLRWGYKWNRPKTVPYWTCLYFQLLGFLIVKENSGSADFKSTGCQDDTSSRSWFLHPSEQPRTWDTKAVMEEVYLAAVEGKRKYWANNSACIVTPITIRHTHSSHVHRSSLYSRRWHHLRRLRSSRSKQRCHFLSRHLHHWSHNSRVTTQHHHSSTALIRKLDSLSNPNRNVLLPVISSAIIVWSIFCCGNCNIWTCGGEQRYCELRKDIGRFAKTRMEGS